MQYVAGTSVAPVDILCTGQYIASGQAPHFSLTAIKTHVLDMLVGMVIMMVMLRMVNPMRMTIEVFSNHSVGVFCHTVGGDSKWVGGIPTLHQRQINKLTHVDVASYIHASTSFKDLLKSKNKLASSKMRYLKADKLKSCKAIKLPSCRADMLT